MKNRDIPMHICLKMMFCGWIADRWGMCKSGDKGLGLASHSLSDLRQAFIIEQSAIAMPPVVSNVSTTY